MINIESFHYELPGYKKNRNNIHSNVLPKAKTNTGVSGYWKACAAVLVAALITQFSYDAVRWYQYKKVADLLRHKRLISLNIGLVKGIL